MVERNDIDDIFRCLLSDISARVDSPQRRYDESCKLLSAFHAIQDCRLRQELVTLIEIISQMPDALQDLRSRSVRGQLAAVH